MTTYHIIEWTDLSVIVMVAKFCVKDGASEFHVTIEQNTVLVNTETEY